MVIFKKIENRLIGIIFLWLLLAGCASIPPELPPTPLPTQTVVPGATRHSSPTAIPSPTPAPRLPTPLPSPAPAAQVDPAAVLGIQPDTPPEDAVLYARADGAIIRHNLADGSDLVILPPDAYELDPAASEGYFLVPILYPPAASPDGRWLLVPTQTQGTWLAALDGSYHRQISEHAIAATWSPDSQHITYTNFANQEYPPHPKAVYVQDVVAGEAPHILTELPARAMYAYWSPGCPSDSYGSGSSCGRHIASLTCQGDNPVTCTVWLIDVRSGDAEDICKFTPLARDSVPWEYAWDETGFDFWLLGQHRTCTILGETLPLSRAFNLIHNVISPDRTLWAFYDPATPALPNMDSALIIRNAHTAAGVFYRSYHNMHRLWWTEDGRHLVVVMGQEVGHDIFLLAPATGERSPIARDATFLGVLSHLKHQGVAPGGWMASYQMLPEAGSEADWPTFYLPELKMTLRAPEGWRVQQVGRGRYVIANFALDRAVGGIRLSPPAMEIVLQREYGRRIPMDAKAWLEMTRTTLPPNKTLEKEMRLAGRPAVRILDIRNPLSESIKTFNENYTVTITRTPLNPEQDKIFQQILASIRWE